MYISYNLTSSDELFNVNGSICVLWFVKNNQSSPQTWGLSGWIIINIGRLLSLSGNYWKIGPGAITDKQVFLWQQVPFLCRKRDLNQPSRGKGWGQSAQHVGLSEGRPKAPQERNSRSLPCYLCLKLLLLTLWNSGGHHLSLTWKYLIFWHFLKNVLCW